MVSMNNVWMNEWQACSGKWLTPFSAAAVRWQKLLDVAFFTSSRARPCILPEGVLSIYSTCQGFMTWDVIRPPSRCSKWMCISQPVTCTHICLAGDEKWKPGGCRAAIGHTMLSATIYPDCSSQTGLWLQVAPFIVPGGAFIQGFYLYMKGEEITPMELSWVQCVFQVRANRVALIF